jgi:hypothetical protein
MAFHWPGVFAGVVPASGYYSVPDDLLTNVRHVHVLAAWGTDQGHDAANAYSSKLVERLRSARVPGVDSFQVKGGRVIGPDLEAKAWEWMAKTRREPLPEQVTYTLFDPEHSGAYWTAINAVVNPGGRRPIDIRGVGHVAETFYVNRRPASVDVRNLGDNQVQLVARNVGEVVLRLSPLRFDLSAPVVVHTARRKTELTPAPSIETLLGNFRRDRDRRRLFPAELRFKP